MGWLYIIGYKHAYLNSNTISVGLIFKTHLYSASLSGETITPSLKDVVKYQRGIRSVSCLTWYHIYGESELNG